ncbi:SDR family oxidoreductase [Streptomyces sp. NPDC047706]|uniref:SDR family oxidoreductase n=1 Tax=Streptomyces sp. NPDC047706 TaxID=3365486 RepID=UPI0037181DAE
MVGGRLAEEQPGARPIARHGVTRPILSGAARTVGAGPSPSHDGHNHHRSHPRTRPGGRPQCLSGVGHAVYLGARDLKRGQETAEQIGARAVQLDLTDDDSVQAAAHLIRQEAGHLDVLIDNAAISGTRTQQGLIVSPASGG